jgi:DNA polymerase/3'-5' exonuclease PolX
MAHLQLENLTLEDPNVEDLQAAYYALLKENQNLRGARESDKHYIDWLDRIWALTDQENRDKIASLKSENNMLKKRVEDLSAVLHDVKGYVHHMRDNIATLHDQRDRGTDFDDALDDVIASYNGLAAITMGDPTL